MQLPIDPTTLVTEIGEDWVTPTKLRPLFQDDPVVVWLEIHGAAFGFYPNQPEYGLTKILEPKGRQFEAAWIARVAPEAQQVCAHAGEGRLAERVHQTIDLMAQRTPVIAQPALWWPQEQLYGVPDVIALASWVRDRLPLLADYIAVEPDHYVVLDLKYTSSLEKKTDDRLYYESQVRLYSYMLGHIQRLMPLHAFIVTRDRLFNPLVQRGGDLPPVCPLRSLVKALLSRPETGGKLPRTCTSCHACLGYRQPTRPRSRRAA